MRCLVLGRRKLIARSRATSFTASMSSTLPRFFGGFFERQKTTQASIGEL
jgi:hypothetical protein